MYSKLIREIKAAVANPALPPEFLADLAQEYEEACESISHRLGKIVGLVNAGYRDEAIELAEQNPSILDGIYQLDFPERAHWLQLLANRELDQPPALPMEAAAELEAAYETQRKLQPIMKKHRLLALSQAPLQARILVLSKLAKHDPLNPLWPVDCEKLQTVRLAEIKNEFSAARSQNDAVRLAELASELKQPWSIQIPKSLATGVAAASQNLARRNTREKMVDIAAALNSALVEYDDAAGRNLRKQWLEYNETARLASDDEVALSAAEPLAWLNELDADLASEREYRTAVQGLESAIEEEMPVAELEQKIYEVQKFERDAPEALIHRTEQYRQTAILTQKRRTGLRVATIAATLLIAVGGAAWFLYQRAADAALSDARSQMEVLVTESSFKAGHQFYETLPEGIRSDGEILRLHQQLSDAEGAEQERQQNFEQLIAKFDLTGKLGSEQTNIIKEARLLATNDAEKKQVVVLENRFQSEKLERQNQRNTDFLGKLTPMKSKLGELMDQTDSVKSVPELAKLARDIENLMIQNKQIIDGTMGVSPALEKTATMMLRQANLRIEEMEKSSEATKSIAKLGFKLSDLSEFASALTAFSKTYPTHSNADEFARSAQELAIWEDFLAWQNLASNVKKRDLHAMSADQISLLLQRINTMNGKLMMLDQQSSVNALLTFLDSERKLLANTEVNRKLISRLKGYFGQSKFSNLNVLIRGQTQYYLVDQVGTDKKFKYFMNDARTLGSQQKEGDLFGLAPHCLASKQIITILDRTAKSKKPDYTQLVFEMIDATMTPSGSTLPEDPQVQCEYLDQILLFAKNASPALRSFADRQRAKMNQKDLLGRDWKVRDEKREEGVRRQAKSFIEDFTAALKKQRNNVGGKNETGFDLSKQWWAAIDYTRVGFVYRENGQWVIWPNQSKTIKPDTKMYVLLPGSKASATIKTIGMFDSGKLASIEPAHLQSGRPVYVRGSAN